MQYNPKPRMRNPSSFTPEEIDLMCIFDMTSRSRMQFQMKSCLLDVYDPDMKRLVKQVMDKLDRISDEEFAQIDFYPDFGDDFDEEE